MKIFTVLSFLFLINFAEAHPVAFKSSLGVMGYHSPNMTHNQVNYSFRHWIAGGIHHIRQPRLKSSGSGTFITANFLLKRWNGSGLQANIYGVLGGGVNSFSGYDRGSGLGLLQFDIEDRDYYFLAKQLFVSGKSNLGLQQSTVRFGITPYKVGYEGLHSWLILEWQSTQFVGQKEFSELTPFLRVFYKNLLFEIGQSFDGVSKFNYISHF